MSFDSKNVFRNLKQNVSNNYFFIFLFIGLNLFLHIQFSKNLSKLFNLSMAKVSPRIQTPKLGSLLTPTVFTDLIHTQISFKAGTN